jgi:hypothetical protein
MSSIGARTTARSSGMETFVIRLWSQSTGAEMEWAGLRGVVEHLGSGRSGTFTEDDELVAFLRGRSWHDRPRLGEGKTS